MTAVNVLRRIELLEKAIATQHSPKLVFVWTAHLAERISAALGPNYQCVTISGIAGCADDDEVEAMIRRDNPDEAARLDRLLAGIPPE
jgi:hypothetical protein